jgi:isoleucyl-tRNA synthetase
VQRVIRAAKAGDWTLDADGNPVCDGTPLLPGEYTLNTVVGGGDGAGQRALAQLPRGGFVALDLELTEALLAEGWARDLIRAIQDQRKALGLLVGDRIDLRLRVTAERLTWAEAQRDLVAQETLAAGLTVTEASPEELAAELDQPDPAVAGSAALGALIELGIAQ